MHFETVTETEFLEDYWQKKPLVLRAGTQSFTSPITPDELAGLALEDVVESRIVQNKSEDYTLQHGPFEASDFAIPDDPPWTLLVQGVDLWVPEVAQLFDHFDFLPRWRMDDIMVSYATPNGGVGPHFDQYDVFLVQAQGSRVWRLGQTCNERTLLLDHPDLKLLAEFEQTAEYELHPGDVLYVPPLLAHWGIAQTESLTYSVGFRAPTVLEMLEDLTDYLASHPASVAKDAFYQDPPLRRDMATETIDPAFIDQAQSLLQRLVNNEELIAQWFARYVTEPKYPELTDISEEQRRVNINGVTYVNGQPLE